MELNINNEIRNVNFDPETPLLWVLRDELELTGTKYGCGIGMCGTCVVLADGEPIRSCITTLAAAFGKSIITIEGLSENADHKLQKSWMEVGVSQCGYCQPGQILTAASLLERNPNPSDEDIDKTMKYNICRCGTYNRIKEAIHKAAGE